MLIFSLKKHQLHKLRFGSLLMLSAICYLLHVKCLCVCVCCPLSQPKSRDLDFHLWDVVYLRENV